MRQAADFRIAGALEGELEILRRQRIAVMEFDALAQRHVDDRTGALGRRNDLVGLGEPVDRLSVRAGRSEGLAGRSR